MGEKGIAPPGEKLKRKSKKWIENKVNLSSFTSENLRRKTTSLMWEAENDPFQVFEVEHESCLDLEVEVQKGEQITKGSAIQDLCDTPDPYVILKVPGSSNASKRTSHIDNTVNPLWNETFHFYLDPQKQHILHITLMDANMIMSDEFLGENMLDVNNLELEVPKTFIIMFNGGSKVHLRITKQKHKNPDLRFSLALCEEEKDFLRLRRVKVMQNMQDILGERGPKFKQEVPVVAVLGSGGGFRAMICLSGVIKALHQSGILSCSTYISGLSGSSWLISTLYAHEKFPNVTYDEVYEELLASVTHNWKWNLIHFHRYIVDMLKKYRGGQPVSFTDIFGNLLGDVLLHGKKDRKLSDQRAIVRQGIVPLPLYTCLHAKASVSCKAFSEWIEFSPFEIGIAKYGTFMKTEDFGSKFVVGKLIKKFPEFPLQYLQGVWGSAFTILIKRLVMQGGAKQDIVQMMREEHEERDINEELENEYLSENVDGHCLEKESSTDDELDVLGADDKIFEDDESFEKEYANLINPRSVNSNLLHSQLEHLSLESRSNDVLEESEMEKTLENNSGKVNHSRGKGFNFDFNKNKHSSLEDEKKQGETNGKDKKMYKKGLSFEFPSNNKLMRGTSRDGTVNFDVRKQSTQSDPGTVLPGFQHQDTRKKMGIRRQGAIRDASTRKGPDDSKTNNYWQDRRKERRTTRERKSSLIQGLLKNSNLLNSRVGRAGEILNPFRGLSLRHSFPLSPFTDVDDEEDTNLDETQEMDFGLGCRYEALDNTAKKLFIVDSGLAFNSPYPLLLRPQRAVDIYLSFDFSQRPSDRHMPFKELILAEKWAIQNKVPFPPVAMQAAEFEKEGEVKELYIFRDQNDRYCPVILHFTIVNNKFKSFKAPGVPRETKEELDFADFSLFNDPCQPFASTNFVYEPLQYERLVKLMEFNTLLFIDTIKEEIAKMVEVKRKISMQTLEQTFNKMQKVMDAARKFKKDDSLRIKVDEEEGRKMINMLRCGSRKSVKSQLSSSLDDNQSNFFDASDHLDSYDEESEYDTDEVEGPEENENGQKAGEGSATEEIDNVRPSSPLEIRNKKIGLTEKISR